MCRHHNCRLQTRSEIEAIANLFKARWTHSGNLTQIVLSYNVEDVENKLNEISHELGQLEHPPEVASIPTKGMLICTRI